MGSLRLGPCLPLRLLVFPLVIEVGRDIVIAVGGGWVVCPQHALADVQGATKQGFRLLVPVGGLEQ